MTIYKVEYQTEIYVEAKDVGDAIDKADEIKWDLVEEPEVNEATKKEIKEWKERDISR